MEFLASMTATGWLAVTAVAAAAALWCVVPLSLVAMARRLSAFERSHASAMASLARDLVRLGDIVQRHASARAPDGTAGHGDETDGAQLRSPAMTRTLH